MSGLDVEKERILEVAAIVTDTSLSPIGEFHKIVYQPQEILDQMDDWCRKTHGDSGLTKLVPGGEKIEKVEQDVLGFVKPYFSGSERILLCGNSVGNDKLFIDRYMPELAKRLHYRIIDVSSFKEIFRTKYGIEVQKKNTHRALDDIQESIDELKTYLSYVKV